MKRQRSIHPRACESGVTRGNGDSGAIPTSLFFCCVIQRTMKTIKYIFLLSAAILLSGSGNLTAGAPKKAAVLRPVAAQPDFPGLPPSPDASTFTDPDFQDYVETVYGYRNPRTAARLDGGFRDALTSLSLTTLMKDRLSAISISQDISHRSQDTGHETQDTSPKSQVTSLKSQSAGAAGAGRYYKVTFANEVGPISSYVNPLDRSALSGFKAGDYVFLTVLPRIGDHPAVIKSLSGSGFRFAGEKTYFTAAGKKTFLLGWAPYSRLDGICRDPLVRRVAIEKKTSGIPFKTRIRFTLRAPGGARSGIFVSDYIRRLGSEAGFASEKVFRLPGNSANAKFTAFEITGSLPVDMVGEISRSPFVAAVEFKDKSL